MTDRNFMTEEEEDRIDLEIADSVLKKIAEGKGRWVGGKELEQRLADIMDAD